MSTKNLLLQSQLVYWIICLFPHCTGKKMQFDKGVTPHPLLKTDQKKENHGGDSINFQIFG